MSKKRFQAGERVEEREGLMVRRWTVLGQRGDQVDVSGRDLNGNPCSTSVPAGNLRRLSAAEAER